MIVIGVALTVTALLAGWWCLTTRLWRTELPSVRALLWLLVAAPFAAQVATQAGWFTTELGRQPWIVYQVLKTGEAVSAAIRPPQVLSSIVLFTIIYVLLSILFVSLLAQKVQHGPTQVDHASGEPPAEKWRTSSLRDGRETAD
jgi:cytochrome d ubiquinol oxidase subunit I